MQSLQSIELITYSGNYCRSLKSHDREARVVTIELRQLTIEPGERVVLHNISWQKFENILDELGEHRNSRIAYIGGKLEIMAPLPEHEKSSELIGDFVKILVEELEIDCECYGSTTFKREDLRSGIEPDQSFYIQNQALMRGMERLNLTIDPPPDLAIEVDVTSKTQLEIYKGLRIPEVWLWGKVEDVMKLKILLLQDGEYIESEYSPNFPKMRLAEVIPRLIKENKVVGRTQTIKAFRTWAREQIDSTRET